MFRRSLFVRSLSSVRRSPVWGVGVAAWIGVSLLAGCDDAAGGPSDVEACSGHGTLHGDHCHCDPGFGPASGDALRCVAVSDAGGGGDVTTPDAPSDADGGGGVPSDPVDAASAALARELLNAPSRARFGTDPNDDRVWEIEAMGRTVVLKVELWESDGGPTEPGVYELDASATSYATCGICVVLQTECVAHGDHAHCGRTFLPVAGGSVEIQQMGGPGAMMQGRLRDVVLREVTIGASLETTDVVDGQTLRIDSWSFLTTVQDGEGPDAECGGHGHSHGSYCHCDPGYRTDPDDPMNCIRA
jgi:hypothetical protein